MCSYCVTAGPAYDTLPSHDSKTKDAFRGSGFQSDLPVKTFKMGKKKVTKFLIQIRKLKLGKLFVYLLDIRNSLTIFLGAKQEI